MELKILLLLFILVVGICIFLYPSLVVAGSVVGGLAIPSAKYGGDTTASPQTTADPSFNMDVKPPTVIIPDNAKIFFDGNNLIHDYAGGKLKANDFYDIADKLSDILYGSFPTQQINFIVKTTDKKKIIQLSKKYPAIVYLFIKIKKTKGPHHMKASDDFTAALLGRTDYIVSNDNFRDFSQWQEIKPFNLITIQDGESSEERICPSVIFSSNFKPKPSNHLKFEITKSDSVPSGTIQPGIPKAKLIIRKI